MFGAFTVFLSTWSRAAFREERGLLKPQVAGCVVWERDAAELREAAEEAVAIGSPSVEPSVAFSVARVGPSSFWSS